MVFIKYARAYLPSLSIDGAIDVLLHLNALTMCNVEPTKANDGIHCAYKVTEWRKTKR